MSTIALPFARVQRRLPLTFWVGIAIIAVCELLLFADVRISQRGVLHSTDAYLTLSEPQGLFATAARWMAINMTAIVWVGLILLCEGVLALTPRGSPVRRRPHHFAMAAIGSICIWCVFDIINFYVFYPRHAWVYIAFPSRFPGRLWGYVLAFAAVVPSMLLIGQIYLNYGWFDWARSRAWPMPRWMVGVMFLIGVGMLT